MTFGLLSARVGHVAAPAAPVLALASGGLNSIPNFTSMLPDDVTVGDTVTLQYDTTSNFLASTTLTRVVTSADIAGAAFPMSGTPLVNGAYFYRSNVSRGVPVSPWSNIVSATISVPAPPALPLFTNLGVGGYGGLGFGQETLLFPWLDIGPPSATRLLIVTLGYIINADVTGVTYDIGSGPVAMTKAIGTVLTSNRGCSIWYATVSSGRFAHIRAIGGSFVACAMRYGMGQAVTVAPSGTPQKLDYSAPADDFTLPSTTIPANGFAVACLYKDFAGTDPVWHGGYVQQNGGAAGTDLDFSMALSTTAGASIASVTRGSSQGTAGCVAAFG